MKKHSFIWLAVICSLVILGVACNEKTTPIPDALKKDLALGEKVFVDKQCGKCHSSSDGSAVPPEMRAPDLTSAFLANDTVFVKAHLQFIELSSMPPLDLTPEETNALTKYVATLHARAKADPNLKNPDGACTVCGAPLKVSQAQAEGMQATFADKTYYFDCVDCQRLFERDASWYMQHGFPVTP